MKTDKKSLTILAVLLLVLLLTAYYILIYSPKNEEIEALKLNIETKEQELTNLQLKIAGENKLNNKIKLLNEDINKLSDRMFVNVEQEGVLKITNNLNDKTEILFDSVVFSEKYDDEMQAKEIDESIVFRTDYNKLMSYLRSIRKYEKNIAIKSISMNTVVSENDGENLEQVDTKLNVQFKSIPLLAQLGKKEEKLISKVISERDLAEGPFAKYEGFVEEVPTVPQVQNTTLPPEATSIDYNTYKPRTTIYDFEDGSPFFVGSDAFVSGSVLRSKIRKSGGYSADMSFDFVTAKEYNSASLVFDKDRVSLPKQPENFIISIYAFEASNHKLAMEILDSAGRDYRISLSDDVDWTDWKDISIKLPDEITYPCVIQRIYAEGIGYTQKLKGRYLFDLMQVEYP